jgi:hypothetical protein
MCVAAAVFRLLTYWCSVVKQQEPVSASECFLNALFLNFLPLNVIFLSRARRPDSLHKRTTPFPKLGVREGNVWGNRRSVGRQRRATPIPWTISACLDRFVAQGTVDRLQTNKLKFVSHQRRTNLNPILSFIWSWIRLQVFTSHHLFPCYLPLTFSISSFYPS